MTTGHKHRHLKVKKNGRLHRVLTKPLLMSTDLKHVEASAYPYGPVFPQMGMQCPVWYLSALSILHRWTGLTLETKT